MPLPVGTWTINADGSPGSLAVGGLTPDGSGNSFFTGTTTFGSNPADNITGFWDETGQEIAFLRLVNPSYSEPDPKVCSAGSLRVIHRLRDGSEALIRDVDAS